MENKAYDDDIEMQPSANTYDNVDDGGQREKRSISDVSDDSSLAARKRKKEAEIKVYHDGPYAGMGKEELLKYSSGMQWRMARWTLLFLLLAGWCVMLGMSVYIIVVSPTCLPWWQTSVIYQIYPRSFMDSDGDGIGDLNGIKSKVDYLKDLGIGAVLLNSIYESPQRDNGYDVSDFNSVDKLFGSNEDFEDLVDTFHEADIKVILDFVPNHSSNKHEFFNKSMASDPDYLSWYTWADTKPNNWLSVYGDTAWNLDVQRTQFYLHQFSMYQPEFNLRNEEVTTYLEDVLENWFVKGVDGFSITGVKYMFETDNFGTDDPVNQNYVDDGLGGPEQYDSLLHTSSSEFNDEQHTLLKSWRQGIFDQFSTAGTYRVMLSDSDSNSTKARTYYGSEDDNEVDLPMNFNLLQLGDVNAGLGTGGNRYTTGHEVYNLVKDWLDNLPAGKWPTFMLGHHGVHRIASRLSPAYAGAANVLLLTLPGTPICYYGDELGLEDAPITINDVQDIKATSDMDRWETKSRDPQRAPMPWNSEANAGFSESTSGTWLPMADYSIVNVENLAMDDGSVLNLFKALTNLRKEFQALRQGSQAFFVKNTNNIISYIREVEGDPERFFIAINFGASMSFENDFYDEANGALPIEGRIAASTHGRPSMERVQLNKLALDQGEGMVVLLDQIVKVSGNYLRQYFVPI